MAQDDDPRCDRCRHWQDDGYERRIADGLEVKRCDKALEWWDASEWGKVTDKRYREERKLKAEHAGTKVFTQDGSDYASELLTAADFFCAHFEPD